MQAAYVVLRALLPSQAPGLGRQRDASIETIESEESVDGGVAWGEFVATELLKERSTDGFPAIGVQDNGSLVVKYRESIPQRGSMTAQVLTSPYHVVAVPFFPGGVKFEKAQ